ncbi:hypothetical protein TNCV_4377521 [Trichonephila clavipes]|nr:hypothetical protein TNCV_4377521 [Trichonephila clavipes]
MDDWPYLKQAQFINKSQQPHKFQQPKLGNAPLHKYGSKSQQIKILRESWVAQWLEDRTPDRKAWVRCPIPPNTLRVHTEYVRFKSVGPKVLWVVTAEPTSAGGWGKFPSPPVPCQNCGVGDRLCHHLS